MSNKENLQSLEQALETLHEIEKKYDEGTRITQTRRVLEKNEHIARNKKVVDDYYQSLIDKDMFVPIYGAGNYPWALPLHLPEYLMAVYGQSRKRRDVARRSRHRRH